MADSKKRRVGRPPKVDDDTLLTTAFKMFANDGYDATSLRVLNTTLSTALVFLVAADVHADSGLPWNLNRLLRLFGAGDRHQTMQKLASHMHGAPGQGCSTASLRGERPRQAHVVRAARRWHQTKAVDLLHHRRSQARARKLVVKVHHDKWCAIGDDILSVSINATQNTKVLETQHRSRSLFELSQDRQAADQDDDLPYARQGPSPLLHSDRQRSKDQVVGLLQVLAS